MKKESTQINCPNCGNAIDVNAILYHQLHEDAQKEFDRKYSDLNKEKKELEKMKSETTDAIDKGVAEKLVSEKQKLEKKIRDRILLESSEQIDTLQKELNEKSHQLKEHNKTKAEVEKLKREKEELRDQILFEKEQEFSQKLKVEKISIRKQISEETAMKIKELEKQLADQKALAEEMKRKAEQGSMQLQGEVQELSVEEFLYKNFPMDNIEPIKKGAKGADCLQIVNTNLKANVGAIYYESKRTKDFQSSWIEKFKQDMRMKGCTFGVLVTQVYPKNMERFGQHEGIWVCSYEEFKGLCFVLRESIIMIESVAVTQENKGDKMSMLYEFLTSGEFKMHIETIVEGFTQMHSGLNKERRAMELLWKEREKQIQKVTLSTTSMYGAIKGIAGNSIKSIKALELPSIENE